MWQGMDCISQVWRASLWSNLNCRKLFELLKNITEVANDFKFNYLVSLSVDGSPSLLVSGISVAGK